MPHGLLPIAAADAAPDLSEPQAVVEAFLAALMASDLDAALDLVDEDLVYVNVGLPTIRGRAGLAKAFAAMDRPTVGFEAYLHAITADGPVVLTERTDVLILRGFRAQFWVCGRFDVHDGKITFHSVCGKAAVAAGVRAGDIIRSVTAICGGKGGGKPDSAMGGGADTLKLDDALATVDDFVAGKLN